MKQRIQSRDILRANRSIGYTVHTVDATGEIYVEIKDC